MFSETEVWIISHILAILIVLPIYLYMEWRSSNTREKKIEKFRKEYPEQYKLLFDETEDNSREL